jgi:5-(carboxyamino)imidazole ribonucleotide mutase
VARAAPVPAARWTGLPAATSLGDLGSIFIDHATCSTRRLVSYAGSARRRGLKVIIAGAGGAAHLPGMVASMTTLPVLGVPVQSRTLNGLDSLLSIVQMPGGIPVGTLAIGEAGARNAALLAASILSLGDRALERRLAAWRDAQTAAVAREPVDLPATPATHGGR